MHNQKTDDDRRIQRPKRYDYENEDKHGDSNNKSYKNNNHPSSQARQKYRYIIKHSLV